MTHADTLRGMAKAFMMAGSHERVDTCLAGADSLDAIGEVRKVMGWAVREWPDLLPAEWRAADGWQRGTSHAVQEIIGRLREALGDTNDHQH